MVTSVARSKRSVKIGLQVNHPTRFPGASVLLKCRGESRVLPCQAEERALQRAKERRFIVRRSKGVAILFSASEVVFVELEKMIRVVLHDYDICSVLLSRIRR